MSDVSPLTAILLRLSHAPGVGHVQLRLALARAVAHGLPSEPLDLLPSALAESVAVTEAWAASGDFMADQIEAARRFDATIVGPSDRDFPPGLLTLPDAPSLLFVRGMLMPFVQRSVAVIGTRHPTRHGAATAWRLGRYFAERACSVVSGLALGCDTRAHGGALEAEGHTVAVLAHGLHTTVPKTHAAVAEAIVDGGGALVSEFPFGTPAVGFRYVQRDRTQAALSNGVILVQSSAKGGSLHACRAALTYGRWVAVAAPTDQDIAEAAPVIEANLILMRGSEAEQAALLKAAPSELNRLHILSGKHDYDRVLPLLWQRAQINDTEQFNDADDFAQRPLHRGEP